MKYISSLKDMVQKTHLYIYTYIENIFKNSVNYYKLYD